MYCQMLLERGMEHGMDTSDLWFDPLFWLLRECRTNRWKLLEAIKMFSDMGLNSTGGLSNNSNGMPKNIRQSWIRISCYGYDAGPYIRNC